MVEIVYCREWRTKVRCTLNARVIMARRYRPRKLFKFWLYHDLTEDVRLMEYIQYLHKTRQFATMVRNGLRLMWTLGQGDMSVLLELFPTLQAQFTPDNSAIIAEFRQMLLQHQPVAMSPPTATQQRQLYAPVLLDDEQDTFVVKKDTSASGTITQNFLNAALGMVKTVYVPLNDETDPNEAQDKPEPSVQPRPVRVPDDDDDDYVPALEPGMMGMKKMA